MFLTPGFMKGDADKDGKLSREEFSKRPPAQSRWVRLRLKVAGQRLKPQALVTAAIILISAMETFG